MRSQIETDFLLPAKGVSRCLDRDDTRRELLFAARVRVGIFVIQRCCAGGKKKGKILERLLKTVCKISGRRDTIDAEETNFSNSRESERFSYRFI